MEKKKQARKPRETSLVKIERPVENVNPHDLIRAAIDKGVSIEVMEKLLDMRERLQREMAERAFRESMSGFQSECPIIPKHKEVFDKNGKLRYKYAPLENIVKDIQPIIKKYGLSFTVDTVIKSEPEGIEAIVNICHILGAERQSTFFAPIQKDAYMTDPQKWASASTFAKRYAFCNAFGILTGDEDNDAIICDDTKHPKNDLNVNMLFDECKSKMSSSKTSVELARIKMEYSGLDYNQEQRDELTAIYDIRKREMIEAEKEKLNGNSK